MKNIIALGICAFGFGALAAVNQFDLGTLPPDPGPAIRAEEMAARGNPPPDRWRIVNGITYDTYGPGFRAWYYPVAKDPRVWKQLGSELVFPKGWFLFSGKVLQVHNGGIRIQGRCNLDTNSPEMTVYIIHYPSLVGEGDTLDIHLAREAGLYTYDTVHGSTITLHQLDYGLVANGPPTAPPPTADKVRAARDAAKVHRAEQAAKTLRYDQETADKGDSYSQRRMGERYRDGEGVEKNLVKARSYLRRAINQGDQQAQKDLGGLEAIAVGHN